ncbi:hypothetical protein N7G274_002581 [Stereocaulon virgatum]|uniref:Uncharacterized protein n=1 Tax=Stereocaulon virgatum TaxID=373712 RepID=A0ABR4AJ13_9LECA
MDEFAQTRGADDLFDDDFTPIAKPETKTPNDQPQSPQRGGRSAHVPRGRGNRALPSPSQLRPTASELTSAATQSPEPDVDASSKVEEAEPSTLPAQQPATPQLPKPPAAVRGDRTATGGIVKPKLTEEELSAKLAAAKLNNAKRAEAHRLAEADEASFQQREAQAQQKRKEEGAARRAMNMEREKNRLRKLGQQAGREWDEGKEEQIPSQGPRYRRDAQGGVAYDSGGGRGRGGRNAVQEGEFGGDSEERRGGYGHRGGRGRGDRGARGRGGRGRGYNQGEHIQDNHAHQKVPDPEADFPALPKAPKKQQSTQGQPLKTADQPLSPAVGGGSWADEGQETKAPQEAL